MDDALRIDVGRAHLVNAAGVVGRVGHHEHPDPTTGAAGGKLPPQRPRHRRGVLEHLVRELRHHENEPKNQRSANEQSTNPERDESTRNGLGQDYLERDPGVGAVAEELNGPGDLVPGSDVGFHGRGFGRLPAAAPPEEKWDSREGTRRLAAEGFGRGRRRRSCVRPQLSSVLFLRRWM